MRRAGFLAASLFAVACSANSAVTPSTSPIAPAVPAQSVPVRADTGTAIATTFAYANGTITVVNASGKAQSLANLAVSFDYGGAIASVWGSPWMKWQIAASAGHYTLTGGTAYGTWPKNGSITISFSAQGSAVPSNLTVVRPPLPALTKCPVRAVESGGTISIRNTGTQGIALDRARLTFDYGGTIGSVWGTPWMKWTVARAASAYTLTGGTPSAGALAPGDTMTVAFSPVSGAHATAVVLRAVCNGSAPSPTPSPTASPNPTPTPKPTPTPSPGPSVPPGATEFVGFWESWSDTNGSDAYSQLGSVPAAVTTTDVAFSIAGDDTIAPVQNYYPLAPGAAAIHKRGGRVLLSFGGATSQFQIADTTAFVQNLKAFQAANPGLYDGFDFDDEVMPWNGQQQLVGIIKAVRAAFPHAVISFDAFMSGADPNVYLTTHQGEAVAVLQQAGDAIDYVNVMDYDQYGWHPSSHPNCTYAAGAADDCRVDVLQDFASVRMPGGSEFPASKVVMGLMIGSADDGSVVSPSDAGTYAGWVKAHGYRGIMIWDLDRDAPSGTGHPKGTYVNTISTGLGT